MQDRFREWCVCLILAMCAFLLCACDEVPDYRGTLKVMIYGEHLQMEDPVRYIPYGESVQFHLTLEDGWQIKCVDYEKISLDYTGAGEAVLTLYQVNRPAFVRIETENSRDTVQICYEANGGRIINSEQKSITFEYDTSLRKRPNTNNGSMFSYSEHTLVGWNTEPDGTGIRIGLGSRVTVDGSLTLYAQWMEWTDQDQFRYQDENGEIIITGCCAQDDTVVIPALLEGKRVAGIASGAFIGNPATTIVLPLELTEIENDAFRNCAVQELVMGDLLTEVSDSSFSDCEQLKTVRINAVAAPRHATVLRDCHYADKMDLLILESEKPRIVFMAGSSIYYNLDGKQVEEALRGQYQVVNVGLNATFSATAQFEIMTALLKEGDVVVHIPEQCSAQQLMISQSMTASLFACLELNYDLFSLVDIRNLTEVFDSLCIYNKIRWNLGETNYEDLPETWFMDEFGCMAVKLEKGNSYEVLNDYADIAPEYLQEDNFQRLNWYYRRIFEKTGNRVLITYAAVNYNGLPEDCREDTWREYAKRYQALADERYALLFGDVSQSVLYGDLFYKSNYHLSTEGKKQWTGILCPYLRGALRQEALLNG